MSFLTGTQVEHFYTLLAPVTQNTYTTARVISAAATPAAPRCIIPAQFFASVPNGTGRSLLVEGFGTVGATSGTNNLTLALALGTTPGTVGTTIVTLCSAITITASMTGGGFNFKCKLQITANIGGSTGLTMEADGWVNVGVVAAGTLSTAPQQVFVSTSTASLPGEASAELQLVGTWSASNAANTTTLKQFDVYGMD